MCDRAPRCGDGTTGAGSESPPRTQRRRGRAPALEQAAARDGARSVMACTVWPGAPVVETCPNDAREPEAGIITMSMRNAREAAGGADELRVASLYTSNGRGSARGQGRGAKSMSIRYVPGRKSGRSGPRAGGQQLPPRMFADDYGRRAVAAEGFDRPVARCYGRTNSSRDTPMARTERSAGRLVSPTARPGGGEGSDHFTFVATARGSVAPGRKQPVEGRQVGASRRTQLCRRVVREVRSKSCDRVLGGEPACRRPMTRDAVEPLQGSNTPRHHSVQVVR